jgi:hypothetical protein
LLLALASTVILGSESHGTHDHILLYDDSGSLQLVFIGREREERNWEVARDTTFKGEGQEIFFPSGFEGSQAVPAHPSGRGMFERVKFRRVGRAAL